MLFAQYASVQISNSKESKLEMNDPDLCHKAITGLGFLLFRHDHLFCSTDVKTFFNRFFMATRGQTDDGDHDDDDGGDDIVVVVVDNAGQSVKVMESIKLSAFHDIQCLILENLTQYLIYNERKSVVESRQIGRAHV